MTGIAQQDRCVTHTRLFRDDKVVEKDFDVADISEKVTDDDNLVWLDLQSPSVSDLSILPEELGLHPLAIEDAIHPHQRPKVDTYKSHLFITTYATTFDDATASVELVEINAFVTKNALVTVHSNEVDLAQLEKRWLEKFTLGHRGASVLVHGLVDMVVDGYFETIEALDDQTDDLEDQLFSDDRTNGQIQQDSFRARKNLGKIRRVVLPMREVVNTLMRRDVGIISDEMAPYYQDVYDHVLRVTEWTEGLRDLVGTVLDTNLNIASNNLNEVMRRLAAWTALIAVPTAVTGFYGQNVPYPGFSKWTGFIASTVAIVVLAGALTVLMKVKKWL